MTRPLTSAESVEEIPLALHVLQKFMLDRTLNALNGQIDPDDEVVDHGGSQGKMSAADHENMLHKMYDAYKDPYTLNDFAALFFSEDELHKLLKLVDKPQQFCEALYKLSEHHPHHHERVILALTLSLRHQGPRHVARERLTDVYAHWPSKKYRMPPNMLSDAILMLDMFADQTDLDTEDADRLVRRYQDGGDISYLMRRMHRNAAAAHPEMTWLKPHPEPSTAPRPEPEPEPEHLTHEQRLENKRRQERLGLRPKLDPRNPNDFG